MVTHTGEKPHTYEVCGKTFSDHGYVLKHERMVHTGVDVLSCALCETNFTNKSALSAHMDMHTGVKRGNYTICENKLQISGVKRHMESKKDIMAQS